MDTFADLVERGIREVETQVALPFLARKEAVAGHKSHVPLDGFLQKFIAVGARGKSDPEKQSALGMGPSDLFGKVFIERLQHHIAAFTVDLADQFDVLLEEVVAGDLVGDHLDEGAGVEVGSLLKLHEFANDFARGNDPAEAEARGKRLGKCTEVDNVTEGV